MTKKDQKRLERAKSQGFDIDTIWYHVTDSKIDEFDITKTADGCIWLTRDKNAAMNGELGAAGSKHIMPLYIRANNLAGWDEYDKLSTGELIRDKFDGALLDEDVMLFYPEQIRSIDAEFLLKNVNKTKLKDKIVIKFKV